MKKERNCAMNSGMYPTYQGMMPIMPMMPQMSSQTMPQMMSPMATNNFNNGGYDQQWDSINNRLTNLEKRVSNLENNNPKVTPLNTYSDTNYYMM